MGQYDNLSKEELLKLIKKQEIDLKSKKYGLVWDDEKEPEQVVLDCRDNLPILKRVKTKEIKEPKDNTQEDNILIEGDNYHALTVLNYTHQEKIDVIYIDPPYNTGNAKEWKYNDCYVDENDGYRHSKWLNFMEKRLRLAKELLTQNGVIFISIDDHEQAQLKLLCDMIFNEKNFVGEIIRKTKSMTGDDGAGFNLQHENLIIYAKNKNYLKLLGNEKNYDNYKNPDNDPNGDWVSGDPSAKSGGESTYFDIENPITKRKDLPPNGRYWAFSQSTLKKYITSGKIKFKETYKENERGFIFKRYKKDLSVENDPVGSLSACDNEYMNQVGTKELKELFGKEIFNNPKPVYFIKKLISYYPNKKNTVLDFFAGSGTTAQAVLELNKEDNGNRKFILCTNNENDICTEITYPRVEKVIKGYDFKGKDKTLLFEKKLTWTDLNKKIENILKEVNEIIEGNKDSYDEIKKEFNNNILKVIGIKNIDGKKAGIGGNLQYFKTSLLQQTKNRDQTKINLTQKCAEMLCLKENIFNVEIEEEDYKIFSSNDNKKFLCVYFNFIDESFNNFLEKIKTLNGEKIIYMFSLEDKIDSSMFKEIDNCTLEAIPKKILEVYKKLVKMNIPIRTETIFIDLDKAKKQIFDDKDKDTGAKTLRVVLEKLVQKIAQKNQINILTDGGKEIKLSTLNDALKTETIFSKLEWEENKIYLTIGNHASHGEYDEFDLTQVNKFYKHIQTLINKFNI